MRSHRMTKCAGFLLTLLLLTAPIPIADAGELHDEMKNIIRSRYGIPAYDMRGDPDNRSARLLNWDKQPLRRNPRTWTGTNGQTLAGKLHDLNVEKQTVDILTKNAIFVVSIENLSEKDQRLLRQFREERAIHHQIQSEANANIAARREYWIRQSEQSKRDDLERRVRELETKKRWGPDRRSW